jgi:nicotinamidase-related amidase
MNTVLILIDIQNIYFTEGKYKLRGPENAAQNAAKLLRYFRDKMLPVIHIKHLFDGAGYLEELEYLRAFHSLVTPETDEIIIEKQYPSAFLGTELDKRLKSLGIQRLVIAGMMTHMCIDTTIRASQDYGYEVIVIDDACATKDLSYHKDIIPAEIVHNTYMASINGVFAKVIDTDEFLLIT